MKNTGTHKGKVMRRVPVERRGLGFFGSVAVFLLLCALAGILLYASVRASDHVADPIVDVGALTHALQDLTGTDGSGGNTTDSQADPQRSNTNNSNQASDPSASSASADPDQDELSKGYYYNQLDDKKKEEYAVVYKMLATRSEVEFPSNDDKEMGRIFSLVSSDHPEFFYADGITSIISSGTTSATIKGRYCYSESQIASLTQSVDAAVDACIAGIPANASDYAKAKYVYDYLIKNVTYSFKIFRKIDSLPYEKAGQNVVSALVDGKSVCSGYARSFQLIMQRLGFTCAHVEGDLTQEDGRHSWCLLQLDGDYYYVDPTWGDHDSSVNDKTVRKWNWSNYGYLCVTTDDMHRSRVADDYQPLPDCTATADNYYVHAKRLLKKPKMATVVKWGNRALAKGKNHFQFRCADQATYEQVRDGMQDVAFNGNPTFYYSYKDDAFTIEVRFD